MNRLTGVVVGLGRIGQGYDYHHRDGSCILTHATGFARHDAYELMAAVDPDPMQRRRFERKFSRPAYPNIAALMARHQPDVISLAVPTASHLEAFEEVIQCRPRAVLCEKPIAARVRDAKRMLALGARKRCALAVNYMRRFEPGALQVKQAIAARAVGQLYKASVWYDGGLLNGGSHFVDLLRFLVGEVSDVTVLRSGRAGRRRDPEPDVYLRMGAVDVYLLAARGGYFALGGFELLGTQGMIRYLDGGAVIEMRGTRPDPVFQGDQALSDERRLIHSEIHRYQWHVLEHLRRHLLEHAPLNSDGRSATETLAVIERIGRLL